MPIQRVCGPLCETTGVPVSWWSTVNALIVLDRQDKTIKEAVSSKAGMDVLVVGLMVVVIADAAALTPKQLTDAEAIVAAIEQEGGRLTRLERRRSSIMNENRRRGANPVTAKRKLGLRRVSRCSSSNCSPHTPIRFLPPPLLSKMICGSRTDTV
uniref:Uncharacterized protein n=1 Tax=Ditylenchus dipsaci TaxID=166011 RepID=A0A915DNA8_9BILA